MLSLPWTSLNPLRLVIVAEAVLVPSAVTKDPLQLKPAGVDVVFAYPAATS